MKFISTCMSMVMLASCDVAAKPNADGNMQFTEQDIAKLNAKIDAGTYGTITSAILLQNGNTLFEAYFNSADMDTHHNMRSVSKTITGMLVGAAIDDGKLKNVQQKAVNFFPELVPFKNPDARKIAISIEDLLTMRSAVECNDWNEFSRGNEERMYIVEDWSAFYWNLPIRNLPSWDKPDNYDGTIMPFAYCTAGVQLVGEIVERVTGRPAPEYAKEKIFDPIGISSPMWGIAATGKAHLGGGLELTTRGWSKIAELALHRGKYDGKTIISEDWFDVSFKKHANIGRDGYTFGYLWWLQDYTVDGKNYGAKMMTGTGGNRVYVLPDHNITLVITKTDFNKGGQAHSQSDAFFKHEIVALLGRTSDY